MPSHESNPPLSVETTWPGYTIVLDGLLDASNGAAIVKVAFRGPRGGQATRFLDADGVAAFERAFYRAKARAS